MEHNDPSRRQYAQNQYTTPQQAQPGNGSSRSQNRTPQPQSGPSQTTPNYTTASQNPRSGSLPDSAQFNTPASFGRFRGVEQSPSGVTGSGRGSHAGVYGFAQPTQYGSSYPVMAGQGLHYVAPDTPRQQDAAQYQPQYAGSVLYNMAPPSALPAAQQAYEQIPRQQQRSSGHSEAFPPSAGYGFQPSDYHMGGQATVTSASTSVLPAQQIGYEQPIYAASNPPGQSIYGGSMMDLAQPGSYATYAPQPSYETNTQPVDQSVIEQHQYETRLKTVFTEVHRGSLRGVEDHLLRASNYLLTNIENLRLHLDYEDANDERNVQLREERIRKWDTFNRAWLTTMQRQLDVTQEVLSMNQNPRESDSLLDSQTLERMATDLVRLCDGLERYGLVDYQLGVAEEEIIDLIIRCLSLLDTTSGSTDDTGGRPESSATAAARGRP